MVSKKSSHKYQVQCQQCGAKLNEFSSEDENDGRIENPS
jgi:hypothetical protein